MRNVEVFIEGQRLDLFDSETINLNRAVQDVKDISKIYTDFTQTFTVPASKNNNKIFKHFEKPEIDNGYDTRIKKNGSITIASLDFLTGKIRLEGVDVENGMPTQYKITFFGNLVSLKDLLGEDKLSGLTWLSQFNHDYNYTTVRQGLEDSLYFDVDGVQKDVIRYPLMSSEKRYIYEESEGQETDTISNIAYIKDTYPNSNNGFLWSDLKPAIGLEYLIRAIQEKYNITFGGSFFYKEEFIRMQMWLSNERGRAKMSAEGEKFIDLGPTRPYVNNGYLQVNIPAPIFGSPASYWTYKVTITPLTNDPYEVNVYNYTTYSGFDVQERFARYEDLTGVQELEGKLELTNSSGFGQTYKLGFFVKAEGVDTYDVQIDIDKWTYQNGDFTITESGTLNVDNLSVNAQVEILKQMPDMTVNDFLTGLFKMFNLTIVPNGDQLEVYNLQDWYVQGTIRDISKYIDRSSTPIDRGNILSSITFNFKKPESFLISQFFKLNSRYYGDESYVFRDENGNKADGESMTISLPFEQMIYEKVKKGVVYGYVADDKQEPYNISAHLMYIVNTSITNTISIIDDFGVSNEVSVYNRPSHRGGFGITGYSTTFSTDFDEYTNTGLNQNLLTNYYLDYILDLFNKKARLFNYKAKLPNEIIRNLKLNDRLIIDGRRYLINNMELNLTAASGNTNLELINDIYKGETQESLIDKMILSATYAEYQNTAGGGSFTYQTNETENPLVKLEVLDIGNGNGWITVTQSGNTINYTVDANTTGGDRYTAIKLTGLNFSESYHKIKQHA